MRPEINLLLTLSRLSLSTTQVEHCRTILRNYQEVFDWGFFIDQASRHRVLPLIGRNISRNRLHYNPEGVPLIPYRWLFESVHYANTKRNEALSVEFGEFFSELNGTGIPYAVRKGPVLAETLYGDPGLRRMYDLDVLVSKEHLADIARILEQRGYARGRVSADGTTVEPFTRGTRVFWRMHVSNELPYVRISEDPAADVFVVDVCLDLFQKNADGRLTVADVLDRRTPVRLCGEQSFALDLPDRFIDLCLHFRKEATARYYIESGVDLQILKFLDVALSCEFITAAEAWPAVRERVVAGGVADTVYFGMHHAALLYPEAVPPDALAALRPADCGFLDEYGAVDGSVGKWRESFVDRLFARDRKGAVQGVSTVPRV